MTCPACGPTAPLASRLTPAELTAIRRRMRYIARDGKRPEIDLTIPEMAHLTKAVGANGGKGYAQSQLYNNEHPPKSKPRHTFPTPGVAAAYEAVKAAASRRGWLEAALAGLSDGGRWRRAGDGPTGQP